MIKQATSSGMVPPEQHGLLNHKCLEGVITNTIFNDMMRQKRWAAAEGSFDAHACYDRVVHNYVSISWQAFDVLL